MKLTHRIIVLTTFTLFGCASILAQSTNLGFPTPITSAEINGTIKARDIGDARLTTYYYQFDGDQGDVFINLVTRNFTGDIDVFTQKDLRPLTKIVVYADFADHETGRVIYLRKPEKMILRVQGRTPGDDPASFRIKFAGSFVASTATESPAGPELPGVTAKNESGIRVNSVGTIVEVIPKATPVPPPPTTVAETEKTEEESRETSAKPDPTAATEDPASRKPEVVVTDNAPVTAPPSTAARRGARGRRGTPPKTTPPADAAPSETAGTTPATEKAKSQTETAKAEAKPPTGTRRGRNTTPPKTTEPEVDPLSNINLVILFKDGSTIQRPLSEVLKFSVDKGVLTVIAKDGTLGRYSMLAVSKVTIE